MRTTATHPPSLILPLCLTLLGGTAAPASAAEPAAPAPAKPAAPAAATSPTAPAGPAAPTAPHAPAAPLAPAATVHAAPLAAPDATPVDAVSVSLTNPLAAARAKETIALGLAELAKVRAGLDLKKALILDAHGTPVLSQIIDSDGDEAPDQIVFQADFGPRETKTFKVALGARKPAVAADYKVYGRFVRERHDDFAWENDRVAHRVYGPDLETAKTEPLISSGIDTWVKRVPKLVVNEWYMTDDYHADHGEGADFYSVGKTRGCGGLGIWSAGALATSHNFTTSRVLANGPVRLIFELTYAPWDAGAGLRVAETKRVTLDAGSAFNHIESTFTVEGGKTPVQVGIGIAKHPGNEQKADPKLAWTGVWEPLDGGKAGHLGCAVMLPPGTKNEMQQIPAEYLLVTSAPARGPLLYFVGSAWEQGAGGINSLAAWAKEGQALSARLAAPLKVKLAALSASH